VKTRVKPPSQVEFGFGMSLGIQSNLRHWYRKRDRSNDQVRFSIE